MEYPKSDRRGRAYRASGGHPFGPRDQWTDAQIALDWAYDLVKENTALRGRVRDLEMVVDMYRQRAMEHDWAVIDAAEEGT